MEQYGKILLFAMPAFLALVLLEKWYGWYKGKDTVPNMDMIASLSSGVTNVTKDVLGLSVAILSYEWLVTHIAIIHLQSGLLTIVIAFIVLDFAGIGYIGLIIQLIFSGTVILSIIVAKSLILPVRCVKAFLLL